MASPRTRTGQRRGVEEDIRTVVAGKVRSPRGETTRLRQEVGRHMEEASAARTRLDHLEPPTPGTVLGRVDHFLSLSQDQIGRHLTTVENKEQLPHSYQIGDEAFREIERLRRWIRDSVDYVRRTGRQPPALRR